MHCLFPCGLSNAYIKDQLTPTGVRLLSGRLGGRCVDILNGKAIWAAGMSLTLGASVVLACHRMTMQADI